jgi:hypothetical protein
LSTPWGERRLANERQGRSEYRCKRCRYHFSLLTGTALHGTRLPLTKWVLAAGLFKIGISSHALARELEISQRIACMVTVFRQLIARNALLRKVRGSVEVDNTSISGRRKGKHGRGAAGKVLVLGLKTRRGRVRSLVIPHLKTQDLRAILNQHVPRGARLYTDELSTYSSCTTVGLSSPTHSALGTLCPRSYSYTRH